MEKTLMAGMAVLLISALGAGALAGTGTQEAVDGKARFEEHCAECHPQGGNIVNPLKSLSGKDRAANGIRTTEDIIARMRDPGPGMTRFDEATLPAAEARSIAEYILKTFR